MEEEIQALNTNNTWTLVQRPKNYNILTNKWVFKEKLKPDGSTDRYKARLVVKGFQQRKGFDYEETFSPVVKFDSLRIMLTIAAANKMKIKQFDLQARLMAGPINKGWLQAAALAHNKEMHAANGNIDTVHSVSPIRDKNIIFGATMMWDYATETEAKLANDAECITRLQRQLPKLYYATPTDRGSQCYTNAGTVYQYLCPAADLRLEEGHIRHAADDERAVQRQAEREAIQVARNRRRTAAMLLTDPARPRDDIEPFPAGDDATNSDEEEAAAGYESDDEPKSNPFLPPIPEDDDNIMRTREYYLDACTANLVGRLNNRYPRRGTLGYRAMRRSMAALALAEDNIYRLADIEHNEEQDEVNELFDPDAPDEAALDRFTQAARNAKWASVGVDCTCTDGQLRKTGFLSNVPMLAAAIDAGINSQQHDYRAMALKIDLYDELRERRILQPSGVEYAWAAPRLVDTAYFHLDVMGQWSYDAIFISSDVIEWAFRYGGMIPVGAADDEETDMWSLLDTSVKIICLPDNVGVTTTGRDAWILAHLTYPLTWAVDTFTMYKVSTGQGVGVDECFVRTASLVDIRDPINKIVFVTPNKSSRQIRMGGHNFTVINVDHRSLQIDPRRATRHNMNDAIKGILDECMAHNGSLRESFSQYAGGYFPKGINWVEINTLSIALTVRWHPGVEGYTAAGALNVLATGAPPGEIRAMGLTPDPAIAAGAYTSYGGLLSVNGLDQRFVRLRDARQNPLMRMGVWGNIAEIAVMAEYAKFDTYNIENPAQVALRIHSGGIDRMNRGAFMRMSMEGFKAAMAQTDRIAFPNAVAGVGPYWSTLIYNPKVPGTCMTWYTHENITKAVKWSWDVNKAVAEGGGTLTGIRTPSSWRRARENTEWGVFHMTKGGRPGSFYDLDNTRDRWSFDFLRQFGVGEDDPVLERAIDKLVLTRNVQRNWGLKYVSHPGGEALEGIAFAIDSSYGGILANAVGWTSNGSAVIPAQVWTYGLASRLKDYRQNALKTLVIPRTTASIICSDMFSEDTILFRGASDESIKSQHNTEI